MADIAIEICVEDADGLMTAFEAGADRIELCSNLQAGGLTPSPGLMELAARLPIPVHAMIRPRPGSFVATPHDLETMAGDIRMVRQAGLAGIVLGLLDDKGNLDATCLHHLLAARGNLSATLHRAFDGIAPDRWPDAVDTAVGLGFDRILTSGGKPTAPEATEELRRIVSLAGDRIGILPGSGINAETAGPLIRSLPVREIHASCSRPVSEDSGFPFSLGIRRMTDATMIRALRAAVQAA